MVVYCNMKNYLVIGGSSGIGLSIVNQLVNTGNNVYSTYFSNELNQLNQKANYIKYNASTDEIDLAHVPDTLDGFVYCPGSISLKPFKRIKSEDLIEDFRLNVVGAITSLQKALPKLLNAEKSSVVLFSSVAVKTGFNFHSQVTTCKGAIEGLAISLAAEFAPKIRVNTISPSLTNTKLSKKLLSNEDKVNANKERHPLKQIGNPDEISELACFLLSDKSSWITGQNIIADGGISSLRV